MFVKDGKLLVLRKMNISAQYITRFFFLFI